MGIFIGNYLLPAVMDIMVVIPTINGRYYRGAALYTSIFKIQVELAVKLT